MAGTVYTEDQVRDLARTKLHLEDTESVQAGVGQLTSFNQLGFRGVKDRPDGWYLPNETHYPALILEVKGSTVKFGEKEREELKKNIRIVQTRYKQVAGLLYNGFELEVYLGEKLVEGEDELMDKEHYLGLFSSNRINKMLIYSLTHSINDTLHFDFLIKNLYHRMIFTACALVAKRHGAVLVKGMSFRLFTTAIRETLESALSADLAKNKKLEILIEVFSEIKLNTQCQQEAINQFIEDVSRISDNINSDFWNGEDVMAIFFNEFNRYKAKSESGQVFTPDHITSFMYQITDTTKQDIVLDAACGSGAFLVKAMCNMVQEAGGVRTQEAHEIAQTHLYGIEYDREIYALACANMLIHKDGKTNLEHMDSRSPEASWWMRDKPITRVLMNPPFENKYGCLDIVENVLNNVPVGTVCAFILPDNKLEKARGRVRRWMQVHRLTKIIKLPKEIFSGVTTSIFMFTVGTPQRNYDVFTCYMAEDGLETIKNQGRHDIRGRWEAIEKQWVDIVRKQTGSETIKWINPYEHLSYQEEINVPMPTRADFMKRALAYALFKQGIEEQPFFENARDHMLYGTPLEKEYEPFFIPVSTPDLPLGTDQWKSFCLGGKDGLFTISKGSRLTKAEQREGRYNYVGASAFNNGITNHIGNDDQLCQAGTISVCYNGSIGEAFYQDEPYWATDDVNVLTPRFRISPHMAIFITTVIKNESIKYAFNNKWTKELMEKSEIILPAKTDGTPDFEFMERYIQSLSYSKLF
ncbi:MAG: N-6 DNA methylase [Bacteroidales bacterium]|nr:N-6 DNA methylase [Bacteroidales bacterium]